MNRCADCRHWGRKAADYLKPCAQPPVMLGKRLESYSTAPDHQCERWQARRGAKKA